MENDSEHQEGEEHFSNQMFGDDNNNGHQEVRGELLSDQIFGNDNDTDHQGEHLSDQRITNAGAAGSETSQEEGAFGSLNASAFSPSLKYMVLCRTDALPKKYDRTVYLHSAKDLILPSGQRFGQGRSIELIQNQTTIRFEFP